MPDKPVVLWDIDGVLADFALGFTELGHSLFPKIEVYGNSVQKFWQVAGNSEEWTHERETACWKVIQNSSSFWADFEPLIVAADRLAMEKLARVTDFRYLTARFGVDAKVQTMDWLYNHDLPYPSKVVLTKGMSKAVMARRVKAVAAIDDAPKFLEELDRDFEGDTYRRVSLYNTFSPGLPVHSVEQFVEGVLESISRKAV